MKLYCPKCGRERKTYLRELFFRQEIICEKCENIFGKKNITKNIVRIICFAIFVSIAVLNEHWKQKIIILVCGGIVTYIIEGIIQYIFFIVRYGKQKIIEDNETKEITYLSNKHNDHLEYKEQNRYIYLLFIVCFVVMIVAITVLWAFKDADTSYKKPGMQEEKKSKIIDTTSNQLSNYNSWIGETSKGKVYLNGGALDSSAYFIYEADKNNILFCIELHKYTNIDIKSEKMEVKFYDDNDVYDDVLFRIKATDTKIILDFDKVEYKNEKRIPEELKYLVLNRQNDEYIVEAQKYMQQKVFDDIKIIKYNKCKIKNNAYRVEVIGEEYLENKKEEIARKFQLNLKVVKKEGKYTVSRISTMK